MTTSKVHQRLAAEEVHLQVPATPGMFDEKVQRAPADLKGHQRAVAVVLSLAGKAVGAVEVAGVGDMQAERLDHARRCAFSGSPAMSGECIGREQLARCAERLDLLEARLDLRCGNFAVSAYFMQDEVGKSPRGTPSRIFR